MRGERRLSGLQFYKRKRSIHLGALREIMLWVLTTAIAVFLAGVLVYFFGFRISLLGQSMEPGLAAGQEVLVDRLVYRVRGIRRGDVIAFYSGGNVEAHPYLKRVVALPGETIELRDGRIYINGESEPEAENYDKIEYAGMLEKPMTLAEDEFFVLGDNRNNSEDSRSSGIGTVSSSMVIGRVWYKLPGDGMMMGTVR